jgi:hypothetical protein
VVSTTSTQRASQPATTPQVDEGDVEGVQSLVDTHGSLVVTSKDDYGLTALHLASATGNDEMVSLFVRCSPDRYKRMLFTLSMHLALRSYLTYLIRTPAVVSWVWSARVHCSLVHPLGTQYNFGNNRRTCAFIFQRHNVALLTCSLSGVNFGPVLPSLRLLFCC